MAVTGATTYANFETNGGAVAEVLSSLVLEQLYDPTDLRALCTRIPYDGAGSDTVHVTQDMVPGAFAAPGENMTTNATAYTTSHFDITVERYSRAYALTDLVPVSGSAIDLQRVVQNLVDGVKGRNKIGIMVTHDLDMAALADGILEMRDGNLNSNLLRGNSILSKQKRE